MKEPEYINSREAIEYAHGLGIHVSPPTVIQWCRKYNLGHQLGDQKWGKWVIDKEKFQEFLRGKN